MTDWEKFCIEAAEKFQGDLVAARLKGKPLISQPAQAYLNKKNKEAYERWEKSND